MGLVQVWLKGNSYKKFLSIKQKKEKKENRTYTVSEIIRFLIDNYKES